MEYSSYKWPYKWVTGVINLLVGVITPFISGKGPSLYEQHGIFVSSYRLSQHRGGSGHGQIALARRCPWQVEISFSRAIFTDFLKKPHMAAYIYLCIYIWYIYIYIYLYMHISYMNVRVTNLSLKFSNFLYPPKEGKNMPKNPCLSFRRSKLMSWYELHDLDSCFFFTKQQAVLGWGYGGYDIYPWTPKPWKMKVFNPNIWVITPKNEGCGFPW